MAVFKCKMCGGDLEVNDGATVFECDYCGTKQTVPSPKDDNLKSLYNRANTLRMRAEFDKAEQIYERIIQAEDSEAEAYWGLVLCEYGIEYVEDPKTFKRIPTCHRASFDSVIANENYKLALENADITQKSIYEAEAKEIDRIQKEIIEISSKEEPYDVFICYKETDENSKRTQDSVIANDIYYQLTNEGFKVFYAAITLENKLGSAYEPCIFAALNSAKVMICIGTKPEYFSAVWVRNEWSRFLKIMKTDRSKLLIPCYRDMDAYDLPEEFSHLQAQDMSKIGFINDVVRGIKKVIEVPERHLQKANSFNINSDNVQLMLADDAMYEGQAFANVPHGYGKAIYKDNSVYDGNWSRGKRHGKGKMTWNDGSVWEGEFKEGKRWNGIGIWYYKDGTFYKGEFNNGKFEGFGIRTYKTAVYEGYFSLGEKNGHGTVTWNDGSQWIGEFKNGERWNGSGIWYYNDGKSFKSKTVNGKNI